MRIRFAVKENRLSDPTQVTASLCREYMHEHGRAWVCDSVNGVLGFSYATQFHRINEQKNFIWALFVSPQWEGQGIGKALLCTAVDWLFAQGAQLVRLSTDTNTRADRFYRQMGWQRGELLSNGEVPYCLHCPPSQD